MARFDFREDLQEFAGFLLFLFLVTIFVFISLFAGGGAGAEEFYAKTIAYQALSIGAIVGLISLLITKYIQKSKGNDWVVGYDFDPEDGFFPKAKWLNSFLNQAIFFWGLFGFLVFIIGVSKNFQFFISTPPVLQQITESAKLFLTLEPAVSVETTLINLATLGWAATGFRYLFREWSNKTLRNTVAGLLGIVVATIFGLLLHLFVYQTSESALVYTAFFWFITNTITVMTGSILGAYIAHAMNNLGLATFKLFASDIVKVIAGFIYFGVLALFIWLKVLQGRRRKKQ